MLKFCRRFLSHKVAVTVVFVILAVACAACIPSVKVNYSMTDYLPEDAESVQALNLMESAFGGDLPNARIYVEGIDLVTADELSQSFADAEGVEEVMWLGTSIDITMPDALQDEDTVSSWKTDDGYLYQLTIDASLGQEAVAAVESLAEEAGATNISMDGSEVSTVVAQQSISVEIALIMLMAVCIVIAILLLTSHSWFEPVIFLLVIGIAIMLNMGTNIVLGEISFVTQICAAILQLAVSMDYAIVLLHTYRRAQSVYDNPEEAMAQAMKKGFSVVLSSAAVTFFGFLSLTVMRFGIGVNMGIVLAKGIVFSFFSVMFLMPCLILLFRKPLERSAHRFLIPSFDKLARVCQKLMVPFAVIVIVVAIPSFVGQDRTDFEYGSASFNSPESEAGQEEAYLEEVFGQSQTWVLMVPEGQWENEQALLDSLNEIEEVTGATSYITVAGRAMPTGVVESETLEQVVSNGWSRIVLTLDVEAESDESFALVEEVRGLAADYYGSDYALAGSDVSIYDLKQVCQEDSTRVKIFSMVAIGLVLALMFRSISLPFIILIAIEASIWINLAIPYFMGESLSYIGYLVIDAVQLGAAVDYAIIYAREYFERRKLYPANEAARSAIKHGGLSIMTSATILGCAGFAIYFISSNGIVSELGMLVGRGALLAMLMMFIFLPCLFRIFDRLICKTTMGLKVYKEGVGPAGGFRAAAAEREAKKAKQAKKAEKAKRAAKK